MQHLEENMWINNNYLLKRLLGTGGFSEVWLANYKHANIDVALKFFAPDKGLGVADLNNFKKEFLTTLNLSHPNLLVAQHLDVLADIQAPFLILPYCPNGSLSSLIHDPEPINENVIAHILIQIGGALAYLHSQNILHQDVKPDNVLIDAQGNYRLSDFGISVKMRNTLRKATSSQQYTSQAYSPPERYDKNPQHSPAGDIFSLGVMLFELSTKELPWEGEGGIVLKRGAEIPYISEFYSNRIQGIIRLCMNLDPNARPSAEQLVEWGTFFLQEGFWPPLPENEKSADFKAKLSLPKQKRRNKFSITEIVGICTILAMILVTVLTWTDNIKYFSKNNEVVQQTVQEPVSDALDLNSNSLTIKNEIIPEVINSNSEKEVVKKDAEPKGTSISEKIENTSGPAGVAELKSGLAFYQKLDFNNAFNAFIEAIGIGNPEASFYMGNMYKNGEGGSLNYNIAKEYFEEGLRKGDIKASYGLALLYSEGLGVTVNKKLANSYFKKAKQAIETAAKNGHYFWSYELGSVYEKGKNLTEVDLKEAIAWYSKSAEAGYIPAQFRLGVIYENENIKNYKLAVHWYQTAANHNYPFAMYNLALMYLYGNGITRDEPEAINLLNKAAEKKYPPAEALLGAIYDEGIGTSPDWEMAANYYQKAAKQGNLLAQTKLGELYLFGLGGLSQNSDEALRLFNKAAKEGYPKAKFYLQVFNEIYKKRNFEMSSSKGDKIIVKNSTLEPNVIDIKDGGKWMEEINFQLHQAQSFEVWPSAYKLLETPEDEISYTNFSPSPKFTESGKHEVWISSNIPKRSIGYLYIVAFVDDEKLMLKIPKALAWAPTNFH
ncbi:hypothetical protein BH23BAC1_BH23BAC1_25480 [soil metagenome]